jgi:hypothetical protein
MVRGDVRMEALIGVGLYTPAEAARLLHIPAPKISRWLSGHRIANRTYEPLWSPEIDLGNETLCLGFHDLMELRVADAFIKAGLSAIQVRAAIILARDLMGKDRPLSTNRFRTDGREIFFTVIETDETGESREALLNLFRKQYEFKSILDPILKSVEFGSDGDPQIWWPAGRRTNIVVDPERAFGQPIDGVTSVPTSALAAAAEVNGISGAARLFEVPESSVRRSVEFEAGLEPRLAA